MRETKFTSGPWVQFVDRGSVYGVEILPAMREGRIARLERDEEHDAEAVDANAALIAAAPDLYEALSELVVLVRGESPGLLNEDSGGDARLSLRIDDALAKAQGVHDTPQANDAQLPTQGG